MVALAIPPFLAAAAAAALEGRTVPERQVGARQALQVERVAAAARRTVATLALLGHRTQDRQEALAQYRSTARLAASVALQTRLAAMALMARVAVAAAAAVLASVGSVAMVVLVSAGRRPPMVLLQVQVAAALVGGAVRARYWERREAMEVSMVVVAREARPMVIRPAPQSRQAVMERLDS